ncbi:hypothetical protein PENTCL1PPCAC_13363, partial [Pristionchus entomophagus]
SPLVAQLAVLGGGLLILHYLLINLSSLFLLIRSSVLHGQLVLLLDRINDINIGEGDLLITLQT